MATDERNISRRRFLRQGANLGLGALIAPAVGGTGLAATKERAVIYQGVSLDSLHPYGYSGGGINGIWLHLIEPLIVMDYTRQKYVGMLADSWEFQGRRWIFQLRRNIRFHNGAPLTSKDVAYSIERMKTDKRSLQGDVQDRGGDARRFTVFTTKNRFLLSPAGLRYILKRKINDSNTPRPGPYKYVSWQRGGNLPGRNDDYWARSRNPRSYQRRRRIGARGGCFGQAD
jgi:peptide/nickel transport system substrate-binding protein